MSHVYHMNAFQIETEDGTNLRVTGCCVSFRKILSGLLSSVLLPILNCDEAIKKVEKIVFDSKETKTKDYNWYLDSHDVNEVKSPYELEVKMASCMNNKKTLTNRFKITNKSQSVSYAIDPDYYYRSGIFKITTLDQCQSLNKVKNGMETKKIKSKSKVKLTLNSSEQNQVK